MFEINLIMLSPHLDVFVDVCGLLINIKINADTKVIVVMQCQIFDRKSTAPSSGDFRRRPQPW